MLVSDIITRARDTLADPSGDRWSDDRLIRLVDDGQKIIATRTKVLRTSVNIVAHPQQSNYNMPSDYDNITRCLYDGTPLEVITRDRLDEKLGSGWESNTGTPEYLVLDRLNKEIIKLSPTPDFTETVPFDLSTATLITVFYTKLPATVTQLTDTLELDETYKFMLVKYIVGSALRDDMDTQNRQFGMEELQIFESWVKEKELAASKNFSAQISYTTKYRSMS